MFPGWRPSTLFCKFSTADPRAFYTDRLIKLLKEAVPKRGIETGECAGSHTNEDSQAEGLV